MVSFADDEACAIISSTWLVRSPGNERTFCYWPRKNSPSFARRHVAPKVTAWGRYEVRVLHETDEYDEAVLFNKKAEYTSNFDGSESDDDVPIRKLRKKNPRYQDYIVEVDAFHEFGPTITILTLASHLVNSALSFYIFSSAYAC